MARFYASVPAKTYGGDVPTLLIEAEAYVDAKSYASRVLGEEGLLCRPNNEDAGADVELRWVGSDMSAGGTPNGRRLEVRKRGKGGAWGKWGSS